MQAVILAAGRGTRMGALTETVPKPMLRVDGKTLLEHKFDALPDQADEIILVVGYLQEVIRNAYGGSYKGRKVSYVVQENIVGGTADALWRAQPVLRDRFLVLMGDDIYERRDMERCTNIEWALLVDDTEELGTRGAVVVDDADVIQGIREHEEHDGGRGLACTNMFMLDTRLFTQPMVPRSPGHSEYGLPQTIVPAARALGIPFRAIRATRWIQITSPEDLVSAERRLAVHID